MVRALYSKPPRFLPLFIQKPRLRTAPPHTLSDNSPGVRLTLVFISTLQVFTEGLQHGGGGKEKREGGGQLLQ